MWRHQPAYMCPFLCPPASNVVLPACVQCHFFVPTCQSKVEKLVGHARFTADKCVEVEGQKYEAKHILIATGGRPIIPDIPGERGGAAVHVRKRERAVCERESCV